MSDAAPTIEVINPEGNVEAAFDIGTKEESFVKDFDAKVAYHEISELEYPLPAFQKPAETEAIEIGLGVRVEVSDIKMDGKHYRFTVSVAQNTMDGFIESHGPSRIVRIPKFTKRVIKQTVSFRSGSPLKIGGDSGWTIRTQIPKGVK